jgi:hypothetical protein
VFSWFYSLLFDLDTLVCRYALGNEYSYYMLLTSSYILNHAQRAGDFVIHPWMHNNSNHLSDADQLRATPVPVGLLDTTCHFTLFCSGIKTHSKR